MKARSVYLGLTGCMLIAVSALAQDSGLRTLPGGALTTSALRPDYRQLIPRRSFRVVVEIKTGADDFRPGSAINQQLVLSDGRGEPPGNLRYWEIRDDIVGYSLSAQAEGIGRDEARIYFIGLSREMTASEIQAFSLKLTFDGAPRNATDSYDNWNIDKMRVYAQGICEGGAGTELARVGYNLSQQRIWQRMSGQNRSARIPMRLTGEAGNEQITKLEARISTGTDDLRGGAIATATVRLVDGTIYPPVNLNNGAGWGGGTNVDVDIALPRPTLASSIDYVEIGFDGAGRNFGESYDNWDIRKVNINSLEACKAKLLFTRTGTPYWRFSEEKNQLMLYFRQD
jgi:hypothetical protein